MAVYTQVSAADLAGFLARYDVGVPTSFKGIAEGVENSNYLVETTRGRFFLTLYEKRVDLADQYDEAWRNRHSEFATKWYVAAENFYEAAREQ